MNVLLSWCSVAAVCTGVFAQSPPQTPSQTPFSQAESLTPIDVSAELTPLLDRFKVPALSVLLLEGERVAMLGAAGVRAKGKSDAVTTRDLWHIGSCTKSMTATLCAMLVEEGVLRWDLSVPEAFPELAERMHPSWSGVTLRHLVMNRGGVPGDVPRPLWSKVWTSNETPAELRRMLIEGITAKELAAKPGEKNIYSNTGFAIAGAMAERATGEAWELLMQRKLFSPLGITTAGFGAPGIPGVTSQPRGHTADGQPISPTHDADNPAAIAPAGTVHMSITDWAKYIALHLQGHKDNPQRVTRLLRPETFDMLHAPEGNYAMGWAVLDRPWADKIVLNHSGSNNSWFAVVWIAPKKNIAVMACCNKGGDGGTRATDTAVWSLIQQQLKIGQPGQ